jgi:16S rRNA (guanine(966)-N(2))-methyltransferase RsmD
MDRMRESLFSILGNLEGSSFLDLFSGSGLVALEAASRGAVSVTAVEKDRGKRDIILKNTAMAGNTIAVHFVPVERFVKRAKPSWDYIFLDPPFAYRHKEQLLGWVAGRGLLSVGGSLLIHHPAPEALPEQIIPAIDAGRNAIVLQRYDLRTYGGSAVDFYGAATFPDEPLSTDNDHLL